MNKNTYLICLILTIFVGAAIRLSIYFVNPPNNSFDDHIEVINIYFSQNYPHPKLCWECYQPPIYYFLSKCIFSTAYTLTNSTYISLKGVQLLNILLSIAILLITARIFWNYKINQMVSLTFLAVMSVLPRDIYMANMICNDYLMYFLSVLAIYFYLCSKSPQRALIYTCIIAVLASNTKQHGILTLIIPLSIFVLNKQFQFNKILLLTICVLLAFSSEVIRFIQTSEFLVSNQHYFDYAKNQHPGNIELINFYKLDLANLIENPFLNESNSHLFLTQIFARTWFDFEWRFVCPQVNIGRFAIASYFIGIFIIIKIGIFLITCKISKSKLLYLSPLLLMIIAFFIVPFIQTYRFPYYSSMKSAFIIPGIHTLLICAPILGSKRTILNSTFLKVSLFLIFLYSIYQIIIYSNFIPHCLSSLSGPLWQIPNFNVK